VTNRERALYLEYMRQHPWARASYALKLAQALAYAEVRGMDWTKCLACNKGVLLPLSDYSHEGAMIIFKAWACSNNKCGFVLRIDRGQTTFDFVGKEK
jgi:hypothetical protein